MQIIKHLLVFYSYICSAKHTNVYCLHKLLAFLRFAFKILLLICINLQDVTRNLHTYIFLTHYVCIKYSKLLHCHELSTTDTQLRLIPNVLYSDEFPKTPHELCQLVLYTSNVINGSRIYCKESYIAVTRFPLFRRPNYNFA